jgi:1-acyl-sn-glycerol-3-phosphate acyltransferase
MSLFINGLINMVDKLPENMRKSVIHSILRSSIKFYATLEVENQNVLEERKKKPTIFVANHLSNIDGPVLNMFLKKHDVAFIAGVKLKDVKITRLIMESLNTIEIKPNSPDMAAVKSAINHLKSGGSLMIFPEGTRSRTASMNRALKGFVLIAKMSGAAIVPIGLSGTDKLLPIKDSDMGRENLRKARVKVTFGDAFTLPKKRDVSVSDFNQYVADYCMLQIAKNLPESYRGYYEGLNEEELLKL